jgi:transcription initiation factor IIE alpha subunit
MMAFSGAQLSIFDPVSHARRGDPETSHEAAGRVREFASGHCSVILRLLNERGPMTCDEIAKHTHLMAHQINKRTADLYRAGKAMPTGETRLSASGRSERVWRAI